jgi:hypothetical protein
MRIMEIPSFRDRIEFWDLNNFYKARLSQDLVLWPEQAISLLGYMCWPNDPEQRDQLMRLMRSWPDGSKQIPPRLRRIQNQWLRAADVFHWYFDLAAGEHQERRGGPSIGKAISLVAANAKSRGTSAANLWDTWGPYKDVAHLVTAAVVIFDDVLRKVGEGQIGQYGLPAHQFMPFPITMMMPDLVLALALGFEQFGLSRIPPGKIESSLNPDTLWRIPSGINVEALPPPSRKLRKQDVAILNARRAGNRGRA